MNILPNYRQRKYAYRLLTLPHGHPTKEILPITLRAGDDSTQPGKLQENDEIWASGQKVRTYVLRLAQQAPIRSSIDLVDGVEPVVHQKSFEFPGEIII